MKQQITIPSHSSITMTKEMFYGFKKRRNNGLPLSGRILVPQNKSKFWKPTQSIKEQIVIVNIVLSCILGSYLLLRFVASCFVGDPAVREMDAILKSESSIHDTVVLENPEYYNYDFKNVDPQLMESFDHGSDQFLIDKFGARELTQSELQSYQDDLNSVVSSTVDIYDLAHFEGDSNGQEKKNHVLVCVPLRDAEPVLPLMFKHLMNLTYPHELIDLAFLVSDCSEGDHTLQAVREYSKHLQNGTLLNVFDDMDKLEKIVGDQSNDGTLGSDKLYLKYMNQDYMNRVKQAFSPPFHENYDKPFRSVQIFQKDFGQIIGQSFSDRHAVQVQGIRRKLMGRARNWLMANALKPYHSWVYWRDADIELSPGTIIQDLMSKDKDIIVPNVWRPLPEFLNTEQPYDLNSWMESDEALKLAKTLDEDDVIVEGYAEYPTWRVHLAYIRDANGNPDEIVPLDGVGGVSILAKAKLFRHGVHFPAFTFENHAETEAFGKMARKMGFSVAGLPHYTLWHIYEPSIDDLLEIAEKERDAARN